MKQEFVALSLVGAFALFAAGFCLAEGLEDMRSGLAYGGDFFVAIMFAMIARSDAKETITNGKFTRRWLVYHHETPEGEKCR